jgi:low affinity Fe/Cu permease
METVLLGSEHRNRNIFAEERFIELLIGSQSLALASSARTVHSANMKSAKKKSWFSRFAKQTARASGRPAAFGLAVAVVLIWLVTGPLFHYSDTWQLVINTGTTIITFLMVFLIQCTQNRDSEAVQVKLDELIRAIDGAHNALLDLEELEEDELDRIRAKYAKLAQQARKSLQADET